MASDFSVASDSLSTGSTTVLAFATSVSWGAPTVARGIHVRDRMVVKRLEWIKFTVENLWSIARLAMMVGTYSGSRSFKSRPSELPRANVPLASPRDFSLKFLCKGLDIAKPVAGNMIPSSSSFFVRPPSRLSRPSSSASQRPPSSISQRPPSSVSQRPPSSISQRPPSSAGRPASSLSIRPGSCVPQRPNSRHSRPGTRQSSRLLPLSQTLVTQITGLSAEDDGENFRTAVDFVSKNLEQTTKGGVGVDMKTIDKKIHGYVQKGRINSRDELSQALEIAYRKLKTQVQQHNDLDQDIKMSHLPDHLQFLIALSVQPTQSTLSFAEFYLENWRNPPKPPPALSWKDILSEEPFQGQHWEGIYGLPPGSTVEGWEAQSRGSTPSLSPLSDYEDADDIISSLDSGELPQETHTSIPSAKRTSFTPNYEQMYGHRAVFEDMQANQYWRSDWRMDISLTRPFDIGDPSTLGPSLCRILKEDLITFVDGSKQERYIYEQDSVREVLMALQGRKNLLLVWTKGPENTFSYVPAPDAPLLPSLTPASQESILASFGRTATLVECLRKFTLSILTSTSPLAPQADQFLRFTRNSSRRYTCTLEAFSEAVDHELRLFYNWCASKEEEICRARCGNGPPIIVSLLDLEKGILDTFSDSFAVLAGISQNAQSHVSLPRSELKELWILPELSSRVLPANATAILLDHLFQAVQEHLSMGDNIISDALMRVFAKTAEPVWSMVGLWLKNGMPVRDPSGVRGIYEGGSLDDEFFIEDNELPLVDPDFWKEGYTLREGDESKSVPVFLTHVAEHVLSSGKAVGLLRALGLQPLLNDGHAWLFDWRSFTALLATETHRELQHHPANAYAPKGTLFSVSADTLSRIVYDELLPHYQTIAARLTEFLTDECVLWKHLSTIENLFFMRKGDAMNHFADMLFARMDGNQTWNDFHFLNTAFGDVVDGAAAKWVETSLVRLSYRGSKDNAINRTVKAIDGLLMEYAVPFPLTYIFGPRIFQAYNSIFVFLLQIRRAKGVLERILVRGSIANAPHLGSDLKVLYAMRSKLSWFTNTLLNFLTTYVIHTQTVGFHDAFRKAKSLDEMIRLHDDHVEKIQSHCILNSNTSAVHRAIISVLDICLHFTDSFVAFAGDTTLDISRQSITMKRHRSHRQRRQRRNVIGFSQALGGSQDSSEDDSDPNADSDLSLSEPSFALDTSSISVEEGIFTRLDKMSSELDGLVRFIRRGVESLAGGPGDAAPAFGVLAFALEDWDL